MVKSGGQGALGGMWLKGDSGRWRKQRMHIWTWYIWRRQWGSNTVSEGSEIGAELESWAGSVVSRAGHARDVTIDEAGTTCIPCKCSSKRCPLITNFLPEPPHSLIFTPLYIKNLEALLIWWFILKEIGIHGRYLRREMTFRFEFMKRCSSNLSEKRLEEGKRQCGKWRGKAWFARGLSVVEISRGKWMN